jgi:hypothetical protein
MAPVSVANVIPVAAPSGSSQIRSCVLIRIGLDQIGIWSFKIASGRAFSVIGICAAGASGKASPEPDTAAEGGPETNP